MKVAANSYFQALSSERERAGFDFKILNRKRCVGQQGIRSTLVRGSLNISNAKKIDTNVLHMLHVLHIFGQVLCM